MSERTVPVGWTPDHDRETFLRTSVRRAREAHCLIAGFSGSGKSMWVVGRLLWLLANTDIQIVLVDPKGETATQLLRWAQLVDPDLQPRDVAHLNAAAGILMPFNVMKLGYPPELIADYLIATTEQGLGAGRLGSRMRPALRELIQVGHALGGSLATCLELLEADPEQLVPLAHQVDDPRLKDFLAFRLGRELAQTRQGLASRLREFTHGPLGAMFGADSAVDLQELISKRLVILNLGGAPFGQRAAMADVASFFLTLLSQTLLDRKIEKDTPNLIFVIEEAQSVIRTSATDVEALYQEVRHKRVCIYTITQALAQITSTPVRTALLANTTTFCSLAPSEEELRYLPRAAIPRPTGRRRHSSGTRLMTLAEEQAHIQRWLTNLGSRTGIYYDRELGRSWVIRTPSVPVSELESAANRISSSTRRAFERGAYGTSASELLESRFRLKLGPRTTQTRRRPPGPQKPVTVVLPE